MARVLVVDDDAATRFLLQCALEADGYQVRTANDVDAVRSAQESQPDVILLDLMMPMVSGHELYHEFRAAPHTTTTPIIFMSAGIAGRAPAGDLRSTDYIAKPFDLDRLYHLVARWAAD